MIDKITKQINTENQFFDFSVLIPSWNNLDILLNCLSSLDKNSKLRIQPIIIINEGSDGTKEYFVNQNKIDYVLSYENIGICFALNAARSLVRSEYIIYANDDMYFLPDWDIEMQQSITKIGHHHFMLSATMIEPDDTGNPCVSLGNYGKSMSDFQESTLLEKYKNHIIPDWKGSTWPPNVVHIDTWDLVGGMSIEFSPGMYSDPDFSMKLYKAGVRYFRGIGSSLVYHFGSKTTKRVKKNKGRNTFILKWGISANTFSKEFLHSGQLWDKNMASPQSNKLSQLIHKLKRILAACKQDI